MPQLLKAQRGILKSFPTSLLVILRRKFKECFYFFGTEFNERTEFFIIAQFNYCFIRGFIIRVKIRRNSVIQTAIFPIKENTVIVIVVIISAIFLQSCAKLNRLCFVAGLNSPNYYHYGGLWVQLLNGTRLQKKARDDGLLTDDYSFMNTEGYSFLHPEVKEIANFMRKEFIPQADSITN